MEKCAGCTNKYKFLERPSICPGCRRSFCQTCLPYKGKKVKKSQPQIATDQCVYCSKQRSINKTEEEDILSNFHERFYRRAHMDAPIQSKLRLDLVMTKSSGKSVYSSQSDSKDTQLPGNIKMSEEDKMLEERLKRLKESPTKTSPSYSEEELRDKLEHLRDDSNQKGNDGGGGENSDTGSAGGKSKDSGGQTQTEETDRLMEKATDEVRLDCRLVDREDMEEEELTRRLQALKGGGDSLGSVGDSTSKKEASLVQLNIETLLDDMDDPVVMEDSPEKLLKDLITFQSKEGKNALAEVASSEIQHVMERSQELAKQESSESTEGSKDTLACIVYPSLPSEEERGDKEVKTVINPEEEAQIAEVIRQGIEELQAENAEQRENVDFIKKTSEQLAQLRAEKDISNDEVVRCKPKPKPDAQLDFSWGHFSTHSSTLNEPGTSGVTLSSPPGAEFNDEVQDLIARMLEEAELDNRLEASGLDYQTQDTHTQSKTKAEDESACSGGAAATAVPSRQTHTVPRVMYDINSDDLPWCCICNDDATIQCSDCDNDLYCQRCFSEGHERFGLYDHHYKMFEPLRK